MKTRSEAAILEQYRVALENVKTQNEIAVQMQDLNYDTTKITEGEELLAATRSAYDFKKLEDGETTEASAAFKNAKENLSSMYRKHRKKAKAVLRKQPEALKKIGIVGIVPQAYTNWIETIRLFYSNTDTGILEKLATLKITPEDMTNGVLAIQQVEQTRAIYLKEVGESEDATKQKDAAFAKMDDWMRDFYAVANIALEEQPQLMEALSRKRKS